MVARQLGADSDGEEGRNAQIYLIFSLKAEDLQLEAEDLQLEAEDLQLEAENLQLEATSRRSALGRGQSWRHFHIRENRFQPVN